MWPMRINLDIGESIALPTSTGHKELRLLDVQEIYWPDYYTQNPARQTLAYARVTLDVAGEQVTLLHRPYQMPAVVNGVRLYVESTRTWASQCEVAPLPVADRAVRLSLLPAGEAWGPEDLVFPIRNFRWCSSMYNNTWCALVPYNLLYYHRGEDYGAIPDRLDVVAMRSGVVLHSPHSVPDSSNSLSILSADQQVISYCHMNIETIPPELRIGARVQAGDALGKTGETWDGRRSQDWDPHLHIDFSIDGSSPEDCYGPYPFLVEAYLQDYPDKILPNAGGHYYALPEETLTLDGSRSVLRPGESLAAMAWHLTDGRVVQAAQVEVTYDRPGLYAEELVVQTASGAEERDYAHVRVYDPHLPPNAVGCGFFHHSPVRGIRPGMQVLFWNRLQQNITSPVRIDFGDGTPPQVIERQCTHAYARAGIFTAVLMGQGLQHEPITLKMRVVVEPA